MRNKDNLVKLRYCYQVVGKYLLVNTISENTTTADFHKDPTWAEFFPGFSH